ncbi:hypothetical protein [Paenibacillus koleovorans]|uniref:hypothetical protein n=1 Tax=Paenibacillus koleovorans TaxID=121608 RepID=UPI000FDB952C|nr:hypothetical protein [Paenibacillus koleovorans]
MFKSSKELLTLVVVTLVLTGFSYGLQPGRTELVEENIDSVSVDSHGVGGLKNYKDAETIRAASELLNGLDQEMTESNYREKWQFTNVNNYTVRINMKDGSTRTFFIEAMRNRGEAYVHPFNRERTYMYPNEKLEPLVHDEWGAR